MSMYVSGDIVKRLRLERGWTQEQLAKAADRSTRTIQRVERSGACDLETRSALAAVFEVKTTQLVDDPSSDQVQTAEGAEPLLYSRLTTGQAIVDVFNGCHAYRFSNEDLKSEDDADYVAQMVAEINDYAECWSDIEPGSRVRATYKFSEMLRDCESRGFFLFGLRTQEKTAIRCRDGSQKPLDFVVANFHFAYPDSERIIVLGEPAERQV